MSETGVTLPISGAGTALTLEQRLFVGASLVQWFAVYTTPRHEKRVAEHFKLRGIEFFLPLYRTVHRWRDGSRPELQLPLFPSYIFVHITRHERGAVLDVPGALALVGSQRNPSPLPDYEIETLRCGLHLRKVEPHPYLIVGQRALIAHGPLAGLEGVLVRKKNNFRVVLSLNLIMQSVAVEVDADDLQPVSSSSRA